MMLFAIGTSAGLLAFFLGWWRASCNFWEHYAPYNVPSIWHNSTVRFGTWCISAVLSIAFASAFALLISNWMGEMIGKFSFGGLLATRWMISGMAAAISTHPELSRIKLMEKEGAMIYERDMKEVLTHLANSESAAAGTTLHEAAGRGDIVAVKGLLLEHPEVVNFTDEGGRTPLYFVAAHGAATKADHVAIAECLLDAGADPNAKTRLGWTPIHAIAMNGSVESLDLAKLLLKKGADIHATANDGVTNWQVFWQHGEEIHKLFKDFEERNPSIT